MKNFHPNTNNILVMIGLVMFPMIGTLYFVADRIWNLYDPTVILVVIVALIGLIGCFLGFSTRVYDGTMVVKEDPEGNRKFLMDLSTEPDDFVEKDELTFRVVRSYLKESLIPEDQPG